MGQSVLAGGLNALTRPGSLSPLGGTRASGLCVLYSLLYMDLLTLSLLEWTLCSAVANPPVLVDRVWAERCTNTRLHVHCFRLGLCCLAVAAV